MADAKPTTHDIVAKLWKECRTLQSAGVSYHNYVTELTFLLFLKMMQETGQERRIPPAYRWTELEKRKGTAQLAFYKKLLRDLGDSKRKQDPIVLSIFGGAQTHIRAATDLKALTNAIDKLDWFSAREDGLGDLYEGLLEKTTSATKTKAGQYFTPRPLIDSIVRVVAPQAGQIIQDPAAGTGGFLVAADRYIKDQTANHKSMDGTPASFQRRKAFVGNEWVPDTHRLCQMNLLLHEIECSVSCVDTLSLDGKKLGRADVVLTNPPFNKMTANVSRDDFSITSAEKVGPMPFLEHVIRALKPDGQAAVILPDNILFGNGTGALLRTWLMDICNLHTILRLPSGIFYAQGVKTNVLFFQRGKSEKNNTRAIWFYDMRSGMPTFGKNTPLLADHFQHFEACYNRPLDRRIDEGENGRFRCFTRDQILQRGDNLDIAWLHTRGAKDDSKLSEPDEIAAAIAVHLRRALSEIEALAEEIHVRSLKGAA